MREVCVHAATDVTGFGLLGHLRNMTKASGCAATLWFDEVPLVSSAWSYVEEGIAPGGTHANLRFLRDSVSFEGLSQEAQLLLCDAQTSGGLLIAVAPEDVSQLQAALSSKSAPCAAVIGRIDAGEPGTARTLRSRDDRAAR